MKLRVIIKLNKHDTEKLTKLAQQYGMGLSELIQEYVERGLMHDHVYAFKEKT